MSKSNTTNEDLKNEVLELMKELRRVPSFKEYNDRYRHRGMINGRFGNWNNFLKSINIEPLQRYYTDEKCSVNGCDNKANNKGMCKNHYMQHLRHNKTFERTRFTENEVIIKNGHAEITVYDKDSNRKGKVLIDADNIERIKGYKIYLKNRNYATVSVSEDRKVHLVEWLFGTLENDKIYSYKNKNRLDCRNENIVVTDREKLSRDRGKDRRNKTGYKGVFYNKKTSKYHANIGHKRQNIYLGSYDTFAEAVEARKEAEKLYWGRIYTD